MKEINKKRKKMIMDRRSQMPRAYRRNYDKAVDGKSLRAAINASCLECVCWQRREVTLCTSLDCPLYAVHPYQKSNKHGSDGLNLNNDNNNVEGN